MDDDLFPVENTAGGIAIDLDPIYEAITAGDVEELATLHLALSSAKRSLAEHARAVETRLAEVMPDKRLELPGRPVMERLGGADRKKWDSDALFDKVLSTGSLTDLKACLPLTGSLGWRVAPLRDLGLDPDEWCETTPGRPTVRIYQGV